MLAKGTVLKNTNKIGDITAAKILVECLNNDIEVFLPFGDGYKVDQIWIYKKSVYRVQIKTSRKIKDKDGIVFNCYSVSNGVKKKYTEDSIDLFATYWDGQIYLVPVKDCPLEVKLWFNTKSQEIDKIRLAKDYTFSKYFGVDNQRGAGSAC